MRKYVHFILYVFFFTAVISSCQDEEISFIPSGNSAFPSSERVEASFYGRLLDQNLLPVMNAEVRIGDDMTVTDSLGDWIIPRINVTSRQAYVKVEADNYFPSSRVLSVLPNSMNLVRIMPNIKDTYTSIQSSSGGTVHLANSSSLTFRPGSFVNEVTGLPYEGEVWVFAHSIDGQSESSQLQMPGRLESTSEDAALISFGMIVTDLETPGGEPLQLKEGMPAKIRYTQTQLAANAPDTIPQWHFDEGTGTWVREGFSVRDGNSYVGEVSHFSWWNCDWPTQLVDFCIQFACIDSIPSLANRTSDNSSYCMRADVTLSELGAAISTRIVVLDENLKYCDILPADETINFYLTNEDGTETRIGPFQTGSSETDFGIHQVTCEELDTDCSLYIPEPPPRPGQPNRPPNGRPEPQTPSPPIQCSLAWSTSSCDNAQQDFWLRVVSNEFNSTPVILRRPPSQEDEVTLTVPSGRRIIVSMIDPQTGEVLGSKQYVPREQIDVGTLNPGSGVIGARALTVTGRLMGCDGVLGDVYVKLTNTEGDLISGVQSGPDGRFSLQTDECDARLTTMTINFPEGDRVFASELFDDHDFGDIRQCATDGNYYWRAKVNSEIYNYATASGRAGINGWVAYSTDLPNPDGYLLSLTHNDRITGPGTYQVGPDNALQFNAFRLARHNFTAASHDFEGRLRVTEYGTIAAGIFTGTCIDGNGETINLEVEMRFVKP